MHVSKYIKKLIMGLIILIFIFNLLFNSFININQNTGFVNYGYSGLYYYLKGDKKQFIYWKEYYKYELMGIDKEYLLYEDNKARIISVDKKNHILDKLVDNIDELNIISANSSKKFKVPILDKNKIDPSVYSTTENVFAISDIEGDFDKFIQLLQNNNVVSNNLEWDFGKGHLVLLGDFFDRGDDVTAVLWLCYKLEQEAEKAGGKVHFILGNHEQMNLQGRLKYVRPKYKALSQKLKIPYKELYGNNSELGRWLRQKHTIIKINNILFAHAGISPNFIKLHETIDITNQNTLKAIDTSSKDLNSSNGEDIGNPLYKYINMESPLWYRGYFQDWGNYKKATQTEVDAVCKYYEVDKIIVGHTIVDEIKNYYKGRVIGIDVQRNQNDKNQKPSALLIESNHFFAVDENGKKFLLK